MTNWDAIVIGSGIGGMSAAGLLAHARGRPQFDVGADPAQPLNMGFQFRRIVGLGDVQPARHRIDAGHGVTITPSAKLSIPSRRLMPDRMWDAMMRAQFPTPK